MNKCIIWKNASGNICVTHPAPQIRQPGETDQELAERIKLKDIPSDATDVKIVENISLPSRYFRESWEIGANGDVEVPIVEARNKKMVKIRDIRNIKLDASDSKNYSVQANGTDGEKSAYNNFRQDLRDAPSSIQSIIDNETDLNAIKNLDPTWPTEP